MSFFLSFHLVLLGPSGAYRLDDGPDLSCQGSTRQPAVDDPRLSCNSRLGVRIPRGAPKMQVRGYQAREDRARVSDRGSPSSVQLLLGHDDVEELGGVDEVVVAVVA